MKEMHGSSSRDDRQKREQQRQEREMAKFAQMYRLNHIVKFFILYPITEINILAIFSFVIRVFSMEIFFYFFSNRADARKQQLENQEESRDISMPVAARSATLVADQDQRKALKFGFSAKSSASKVFTSCFQELEMVVLLLFILLSAS